MIAKHWLAGAAGSALLLALAIHPAEAQAPSFL